MQGSNGFPGFPGANGEKGTRVSREANYPVLFICELIPPHFSRFLTCLLSASATACTAEETRSLTVNEQKSTTKVTVLIHSLVNSQLRLAKK